MMRTLRQVSAVLLVVGAAPCALHAQALQTAREAASPSSRDAAAAPAGDATLQASSANPTPSLFENLSVFVGPDGSKQPQDLGINANMGVRFAANWGVPIAEEQKLGAQIGIAFNVSDGAVHVLDQIGGPGYRRQTFLTFGVFERPTPRLSWGAVYDVLFEHYYSDFGLGQVRGQVGYGLTEDNEVGLWVAKATEGANTQTLGTPVRLDPITQFNFYARHTWATAAQTTVWLGTANGHEDIVWVFPPKTDTRDAHVLVWGAQLLLPLSDRFAVTGAANFLTPASTGTVDAYLGISFFPARSAQRAAHNTFAPITDVANNPTMAVDLRR